MYGLKVYIEPKDILQRLNDEDKQRFNQCVFTDIHKCMDGSVEVDCVLFMDDENDMCSTRQKLIIDKFCKIGFPHDISPQELQECINENSKHQD